MLLNVVTGVPVMVLCLLVQAIFATIGLRRYVSAPRTGRAHEHWLRDIQLLSVVMKPPTPAKEPTCRGALRPTGMWRPFPEDRSASCATLQR